MDSAFRRCSAAVEGFDVTTLRLGFLYAPDAGHTRQMGEGLLSGDLPVVGGGPLGRRDAELSLLHADDAAAAIVAAIEADATGLYHVVDEEPVTVAEYFGTFAAELGAQEPRRVPGWIARFFVGEEQANLLPRPFPTTADRFRRDVGWSPAFPTYREGLARVVEAWAEDGTIRETASGYEWIGGPVSREEDVPVHARGTLRGRTRRRAGTLLSAVATSWRRVERGPTIDPGRDDGAISTPRRPSAPCRR